MRNLKLIWDFKGIDAKKIAQHHEVHLKEFIEQENVPVTITGIEIINSNHAIAYLVVKEDAMKSLRDALKPHRGQVYQQ